MVEKPILTPVKCGSDITAANGTIESPNYPDSYPNNAHCIWNIELPNKGGKIMWRIEEENVHKAKTFAFLTKLYINKLNFLTIA